MPCKPVIPNVLLMILIFGFPSMVYSQKDTLRIHSYVVGPGSFEITITNNTEFLVKDRYSEILKGDLITKDGLQVLSCDTTTMGRNDRQFYHELRESIHLAWHPGANAYLLKMTTDPARWLYIDTSQLTSEPAGYYLSSNGYVGCGLSLSNNGLFTFHPFSDVGGSETIDSCSWSKRGEILYLDGDPAIDKWYTDTRQFYVLPYLLAGKKIQRTDKVIKEVYTYFLKRHGDE